MIPGNYGCTLVNARTTLDGIIRVSDWLADREWFKSDERLLRTIEKSGDNMAYGFKGGGWTIVTPNCPTNSLPLLWYESAGNYEGPFPRIMSRTSQARGVGEEVTRIATEQADRALRKLGA